MAPWGKLHPQNEPSLTGAAQKGPLPPSYGSISSVDGFGQEKSRESEKCLLSTKNPSKDRGYTRSSAVVTP